MHATAAARARTRAGAVSLVVSTLVLAAKFYAWHRTGSQAVFSDAMESIVNVVAAGFMLFAIALSNQPPDDNHPYGHGKIEFITGGFEGGLIAFAAMVIIYEAVLALLAGAAPHHLDLGMALVGAAGLVNLALGVYLVRVGRRHDSHALVADGKHVISDFWTSAGAVVGLLLVRLTDIAWLDPAIAIVVALLLLRTGYKLLREAARGLMDEHDPELVAEIATALEAGRRTGIIEVHELRAINLGNAHHVDLHVVVPEFWSVEDAHDRMDVYERAVQQQLGRRCELQFHVDPCERAYCRRCDLPECPVRREELTERRPITPESVVQGPRPPRGRTVHDHEAPEPRDG